MDDDHSINSSGGNSVAEGDEKSLISVSINPFVASSFTLKSRKFSPSNTFGDIRAAILSQVSPDDELYEFNDPKTDFIMLPGGPDYLEDDWTIASQFKTRCPTSITIILYPTAAARLRTLTPPRDQAI